MPNFGKLLDKAKQFAGKHPNQVDKGVGQGEQYANEKTGGKHERQIHEGGQKAEEYLGTQDQGSPGQESGSQ
jgi:hypothetical protein